MNTCIHTYIRVVFLCIFACTRINSASVHTCMYQYIHTYIHIQIHVAYFSRYACINMCDLSCKSIGHACIYVYMFACTRCRFVTLGTCESPKQHECIVQARHAPINWDMSRSYTVTSAYKALRSAYGHSCVHEHRNAHMHGAVLPKGWLMTTWQALAHGVRRTH
jgi:hypothetical protein